MTKENMFFISPQTSSVYVKVTTGEPFVGVRRISEKNDATGRYRITVRGDYDSLVELNLPGFSGMKNHDHRSIVVPPELLDYHVDMAVAAIGAKGSVMPWKEVLEEIDSSATIECPECGSILHV